MAGHGELMDGIYRTQRHFYDLTRKYYLLGRDGLIADLAPPPVGSVLEIGCGTGRNLVAVGRAWPGVQLFGVDISEAMLETAREAIRKDGLASRAVVARGDACDFDADALFGRATFDRVFISYALSMIPDWKRALMHAAACVAPGGRLVYSTCSLEPEENERVITEFFKSRAGEKFTLEASATSFPWQTGHDGAGAFRLRRRQ